MAAFLATSAVLTLDPLVFLPALLVGALARSWRGFLIAAAASGGLVHLAATTVVWRARVGFGEPGTWFDVLTSTVAPLLLAFLALALIAAGIARLVRRRRRP